MLKTFRTSRTMLGALLLATGAVVFCPHADHCTHVDVVATVWAEIDLEGCAHDDQHEQHSNHSHQQGDADGLHNHDFRPSPARVSVPASVLAALSQVPVLRLVTPHPATGALAGPEDASGGPLAQWQAIRLLT